jgi:hypothetical protein
MYDPLLRLLKEMVLETGVTLSLNQVGPPYVGPGAARTSSSTLCTA